MLMLCLFLSWASRQTLLLSIHGILDSPWICAYPMLFGFTISSGIGDGLTMGFAHIKNDLPILSQISSVKEWGDSGPLHGCVKYLYLGTATRVNEHQFPSAQAVFCVFPTVQFALQFYNLKQLKVSKTKLLELCVLVVLAQLIAIGKLPILTKLSNFVHK